MNVCTSQILIDLFIVLLNINNIIICLIYNQKKIEYSQYRNRVMLSLLPMLACQIYILIYFKALILSPVASFLIVVASIIIGIVDISKGLLSLMIVVTILINPTLFIFSIIDLTLNCGPQYSPDHYNFIYIISISVVVMSTFIMLLTAIVITSIPNIILRCSNITNSLYLSSFSNGYTPINEGPTDDEGLEGYEDFEQENSLDKKIIL